MNDVVYLIQVASGATKIGITDDITARLSQLQIGSPVKLFLRYTINCPSRDSAKKVESILHDRYGDQHVRGEWFKVDPDVIVKDLEFVFALLPHLSDASITEGMKSFAYKFERVDEPTPKADAVQSHLNRMATFADQIVTLIDCHPEVRMTHREIFLRLPSCSKTMVKVAIHRLIDDGRLVAVPFSENPHDGKYFICAIEKVL